MNMIVDGNFVRSNLRQLQPLWISEGWPYGKNNWDVHGLKVNREVWRFSDLEYYHWVLVEFDYQVIWYCEEPLKVTVVLDGEEVKTIFDMVLLYANGKIVFIEVKHEEDMEEAARQIRAQKKWCHDNGFEHETITDKDIKSSEIALDNMINILSDLIFMEGRLDQDIANEIIDYFTQSQEFTFADVYSAINSYSREYVRSSIYRLIYEGKVVADLKSEIINLNTKMRVNDVFQKTL